MALTSALNIPKGIYCPQFPSSGQQPPPANLTLARHFPTRFASTLTFAGRRNHRAEVASSKPKIKKKSGGKKEVKEEEDVDEDAIDALFRLLEEDLKNDGISLDDDEELTEEELAKLEQEVAEALGIDEDDVDDDDEDEDDDEDDDDDDDDDIESYVDEEDEEDDDEVVEDDDEEEEEEVESPVKLKTWQLRRLAAALKVGRRKTSIKILAAELCLDRPVVLELLRNPPPSLLMMCATLPDEPARVVPVSQPEPVEETVVETTVETLVETTTSSTELETEVKVPIHVMQQKFSGQKRLKKAQVETLESVYRKTKRPTNTMISSIVHVTNLPRKRVVKWFEDKRAEEGVPDSRHPYQRPAPNTV